MIYRAAQKSGASCDTPLARVVQRKEKRSWPPGYFERTAGSLADDFIERPPQGEYEERDELL